LKDSTTPTQASQLVSEIRALPNVQSVVYLTKEQVLQQYLQQNSDDSTLQAAISQTANPLPATIEIKPRDLNKIEDIRTFLTQTNIAALQSDQPSYSGDRKEAIDKITHATDILREVGFGAVILFTLISALIIFNTIQMAIFNRRDEIQIMRLLGASTHYIRGPFVVESIVYGVLSAVISILIINGAFQASSSALQASSLGLLDIGYASQYFDNHFLRFLTLQLGIGIVIGAASSIIATRRYLKFKTAR
jgi:cell division transport system permease protein